MQGADPARKSNFPIFFCMNLLRNDGHTHGKRHEASGLFRSPFGEVDFLPYYPFYSFGKTADPSPDGNFHFHYLVALEGITRRPSAKIYSLPRFSGSPPGF